VRRGVLDGVALAGRHDPALDIVGQREHGRRFHSDGEHRRRGDRRQHGGEPGAPEWARIWQGAFEDGVFAGDGGPEHRRHGADEALGRSGGQLADNRHADAGTVLPHLAVRVQQQFEHSRVSQPIAKRGAELALQRLHQATGQLLARSECYDIRHCRFQPPIKSFQDDLGRHKPERQAQKYLKADFFLMEGKWRDQSYLRVLTLAHRFFGEDRKPGRYPA